MINYAHLVSIAVVVDLAIRLVEVLTRVGDAIVPFAKAISLFDIIRICNFHKLDSALKMRRG